MRSAAVWFVATLAIQAADGQTPGGSLEEVIVTAEERAENLQDAPVSVTVLPQQRLEALQTSDLAGYARFLPSLAIQWGGPGLGLLSMRGITNNSDGPKSGSQPVVALYVNDTPVSAIDDYPDIHIYDVARVEALSGPQGTLYGASALSGAVRIVTNEPDPARFDASYDAGVNDFTDGSAGSKFEGMANFPIGGRAALRIVGFVEHDGGYINNVVGPEEVYPTSGLPRDNSALARAHFNEVNSSGARAAVKLDLTERWSITPSVIQQQTLQSGVMFYTPALGDLNVARYLPDGNTDRWWLGALNVQGKIADLDLTYAGGYLHRNNRLAFDNSDLSYALDEASPGIYGLFFRDDEGNLIRPGYWSDAEDQYQKISHEIRLATPDTAPFHATAGLFWERQLDDTANYARFPDLGTQYSISGMPGVLFMNVLQRVDRDRALYVDGSYDMRSWITLFGGVRWFTYDDTVYGFSGSNGQPTTFGFTMPVGENSCFPGTTGSGEPWPCVNVDNRATRSGEIHRLGARLRLDSQRMVYVTWSTGYRPGGGNLLPGLPPYKPDFLANYELGWKTEWLQGRMRFDGALFYEQWKDAQVTLVDAGEIPIVINADRAHTRGLESQLAWQASPALALSTSLAWTDARVDSTVCTFPSPSNSCTEPSIAYDSQGDVIAVAPNSKQAGPGDRLPVTPRLKGDLTVRDEFPLHFAKGFVQFALTGQTNAPAVLNPDVARRTGFLPGYASVDLISGVDHQDWHAEIGVHNLFDRRGQLVRQTPCDPALCSLVQVVPIQPRLVGITFGQRF
jgi:iron complex outermembrane receptor protein